MKYYSIWSNGKLYLIQAASRNDARVLCVKHNLEPSYTIKLAYPDEIVKLVHEVISS